MAYGRPALEVEEQGCCQYQKWQSKRFSTPWISVGIDLLWEKERAESNEMDETVISGAAGGSSMRQRCKLWRWQRGRKCQKFDRWKKSMIQSEKTKKALKCALSRRANSKDAFSATELIATSIKEKRKICCWHPCNLMTTW